MKKILAISLSILAGMCVISCDNDDDSDSETSQCDVTKCETPENATAKCTENACDFECNQGYVKDGKTCKKSDAKCDVTKCEAPENATAKCTENACDFECNQGYVKDGNSCKASEPYTCDPSIKDDVYGCQGAWRVVCKNGEAWIDTSDQKLGTLNCAADGLTCHEQKGSDGTVYDAYCTICNETDLSNCTVTNTETMVPTCVDGGFEGMVCDFNCKSGYKKNEAEDDCIPE